MIRIDGGGDGSRIRDAELEARRAAEEAARRAAEEAARRRAQLLAREARLDRLEARSEAGPFAPSATSTAAATPSGPSYSPERLAQMEAGASLPPVDGAPPPPPDPLSDEQARRLVAVSQLAASAWEGLPGDVELVTVRPGDDPAAIVEAWITAGRSAIGPGDPAAYATYAERQRDVLDQLAGLLTPQVARPLDLLQGQDSSAFANQWIRPALSALEQQHPEASFRVLAVEWGALPPRLMGGLYGENTSQLVIEMRQGDAVEHYTVNPYLLLGPTPGQSEVAAALTDARLVESWYTAMRGQLPAHVDQGTAAETLEYLTSSHYDEAVLQGVLGMPAPDQAAFVAAYGQVTGADAQHPLGLLARVEGISPQNTFAAVDAEALAASGPVVTTVDVRAVDALRKLENFIQQNYEQVVAPTFAQYLALRGDEPRALWGTDLVNEIGVAMHLPPNHLPQTAEERAALQEGRFELYTGDARALIDAVAGRIEAVAGMCPAQVAVLPVTYYSDETGIVELPLFRVDVPGGQEIFVDNEGRSYAGFEAWRAENRLPPGRVTYPSGGHLSPGEAGRALTVTEPTARTVDTIQEWALQAGDTVALVGGLVVLAGAVVGSGGALLPVTAAALAAWGGARSAGTLVDRAEHGQTLSLADPEARAEWLSLGANALGIAALGSGSLARALSQGGSRFATAASSVARLTHWGAEAADALTIGDLVHRYFTDPSLTPEDRLMIVAQVGFWAGQGAVTARSERGLYSLDAAESTLAAAAARDAGRPTLPPDSGLTPRFEAAVAAALRELGIDAIGFRPSTVGGSFWHDVGGPTQRDSWRVVENFLAGEGAPAGAYVPTKPEDAFTLARVRTTEETEVRPDGTVVVHPAGSVDLSTAQALDAYLRASELEAGLIDVFPMLEGVLLTDASGQIVGLQRMLGGATPVVMNPELQTMTIDGREITVPVGPVGITVSDYDIAYVVRDGRYLTEAEVRDQLIPAINRHYSPGGYDVVNHPDHFSAMLDPYLNERHDLSKDEYWNGPVYSFDASGYTGEGPLGPTLQRLFNLPPEWHGGSAPPDWAPVRPE